MQSMNKRRSHWLRRNHGTSVPTNFVFVDCQPHIYKGTEDDKQETHTLGAVCGITGRLEKGRGTRKETIVAHNTDDFWGWLSPRLSHRRPLWFVAYNCSYVLSLLGFWSKLTSRDFTFDRIAYTDTRGKRSLTDAGFLVSNDPPTVVSVHSQLGTIYAIDIRNYWRLSIANLAELTGTTLNERPGEAAELPEWIDYTVSRTKVVRAAMLELCRFWHDNDLGEFGFTASSLAWHAYRHRWMPTQWRNAGTVGTLLVHDDFEALKVERAAMAGGECRVFYARDVRPVMEPQDGKLWRPIPDTDGRGEGPVYCLDVSSLYPHVMREGIFPTELVVHQPNGCMDDIIAWRKYLAVIARVQVETHDETYPFRQSRREGPESARQGIREDETYWARGRFWTTLCGPELARAVDMGHVKAVGPIVAFKWGRAFRQWVDHWWAVRLKYLDADDVCRSGFVKLLLNSLAGKFGQRTNPWVDDPDFKSPMPWGFYGYTNRGKHDGRLRRFFGWLSQIEAEPGEAPHSIPSVAAHIYAYARDRMRSLRIIVGVQNLYYQDTDSLHVTEQGYHNLERAGEVAARTLGKLRLERIVTHAIYRGPKDYTHDGKHTVSGLKEDSRQQGPYAFVQDETEGLNGLVGRFGDPKGEGVDATARVQNKTFRFGGMHARGIVTKSGSVNPPIVWDGDLILTDGIEPWRTKWNRKPVPQA